MPKLIDLTGRKIGHWTVLERGPNGSNSITRWWCRCDCGKRRLVPTQNFLRRLSTRCLDCANAAKQKKIKHNGLALTYAEWAKRLGLKPASVRMRLARNPKSRALGAVNGQLARPGHPVTIGGVTRNMTAWAAIVGISREAFWQRVASGKRGKALLAPANPRGKSSKAARRG
jgi:hypothetical protein